VAVRVVVDVTAATEAVTVEAETLQQEQALLYREASEQALAYAGTVLGEAGADGVLAASVVTVVGVRLAIGVADSSPGAVVAVTVTELVSVTHTVL
jgi:hypothetical protein